MKGIFKASWQNCVVPYTSLSFMVFLLLHPSLYSPLTLILKALHPVLGGLTDLGLG